MVATPHPHTEQPLTRALATAGAVRRGSWHWAGLAAVSLISAVLNSYNLNHLGYANQYYAATVKSMLQSWHNFFSPRSIQGKYASVDKPPRWRAWPRSS